MKNFKIDQLLTFLATLLTITVNGLANVLPLNGLNTGEISDRFEIYFVPAGYVFSIWGVIYLGMLAYTIFQALPSQADNPVLKRIAPYYWIGSLANIIWLFLWHYELFSWTILFMLLILVSLVLIIRNLSEVKGFNKWLVRLPFSIYLGWISVATIANASQWLYYLSWNGWGVAAANWAVIMLAVASLLGMLMSWLENDTAYGLVLIWAFVGITVSQAGMPGIVLAAWIGSALIGISILGSILKYKKVY
jgi:benzodiazapine receptor